MHDPRQTFAQASGFFIAVAEHVRDDQWDDPGLGVWSVRDLVGHTSLAHTNVERDLAAPPSTRSVEDAVAFFEAGLAVPGVEERVAQRGREAGVALGADPVSVVRGVADQASAIVAQLPDESILATSIGSMRLPSYLPTKTFELMVHTLDLAAAIGLKVEPPADALAESVEIAVALAL